MYSYKPLRPVTEQPIEDTLSDDHLYWDRMKELAVFQEPGNISSSDFSSVDPYYLASTSSIRLTVFDTTICEPISVYSRFKSVVYGATYRHDGALLGVGSQDGYVHFFDSHKGQGGPRNALRSFQAHQVPVHVVGFTSSGRNVGTLADDGAIKLWDLSISKGATPLWEVQAHKDHIRCGQFSRENEHILATGSYDHTVKLWDTRIKTENSMINMDHGAPVEKLLIFPRDRIIATAGGPVIKLWDMTNGGRLMHVLEHHHKTVTSLCFASNKTRILSGGLDKRINIFRVDTGDFDLIYSFKTPAPVLTLSMAENDECMAFGMTNLLSIYRRRLQEKLYPTTVDPRKRIKKKAIIGDMKSRTRFAASKVKQRERGGELEKVELTAPILDKVSLGKLDNLIRTKKYRQTVDKMLSMKKFTKKHPEIVTAAFEQIRLRNQLHPVLVDRDEKSLVQILLFLRYNLFNNLYFDTLYEVTNTLISIYVEEHVHPKVAKIFKALKNDINCEIHLHENLAKTSGALDLLIKSSIIAQREQNDKSEEPIFGDVLITPILFQMNPEDEQKQETK